MVKGIDLTKVEDFNCEICIKGKQAQAAFPKNNECKVKNILELIHSDVCGPMRTESLGKNKYFATFIDQKSNWAEVYFLGHKNEVKDAFEKFKARAENFHERKIKTLRTDNGLEYLGKNFTDMLNKNGIKREFTVPYTPQQNGKAERMNRTLVEMARCLLLESGLPDTFWAEAVQTANYIRNRCPSKSLKNNVTPYEIWHKEKPDVSNFRKFGCKAFLLDKTPTLGKFTPRSKECIFLGYSNEAKAYRLWDPNSRKLLTGRDVKFLEDRNALGQEKIADEQLYIEIEVQDETKSEPLNEQSDLQESSKEEHNEDISVEEEEIFDNSVREDFLSAEEDDVEYDVPTPNQSKRGRGRPKIIRTGQRGRPKKLYQTNNNEFAGLSIVNNDDQPTVEEALEGPNKREWKEAMRLEINTLKNKGAWTLVNRPPHSKVIGCRWVLRTKYNANGTIERRKARLVAKGYNQRPGIDFDETFSPVARQSTIRIIMAIASEMELEIFQLDVVLAYINGDLQETIYMEQPEGFVEKKMKTSYAA